MNDSYVGTFPLPTDLAPGDVQLGSAFLLDNNRPDTQVVYTDFSVWSLESP